MIQIAADNTKKYTILLVEDDQTLQNLYREILTSHGFNLVNASDGQEAFELFAKQKIDLIITDIMLPRVTGIEFLTKVRNTPQGKNIPAIAWSNLTYEEEKRKAAEAGANEYIVKDSLSMEEIISVVKKYLN